MPLNSISVIGPRVLRPHSPYRVALAGGTRTQSLYVAVEGRRANGEQFTQGRETQLQSGSSRILDLDVSTISGYTLRLLSFVSPHKQILNNQQIGDPGPGTYSLVARSTSGPTFSSSAPIVYQARSFCIFIQSDKRVYQPGDTISFRVVALDK